MKKDIHPAYYQTPVVCACGNTFTVGSTMKETMKVEVCYNCHPFYTGKQKLIDSAGRVDSFRRRTEIAKAMEEKKKSKASKKHAGEEEDAMEELPNEMESAPVSEVNETEVNAENDQASAKKATAKKPAAKKPTAKAKVPVKKKA